MRLICTANVKICYAAPKSWIHIARSNYHNPHNVMKGGTMVDGHGDNHDDKITILKTGPHYLC